jgi:hypothetical protein
MNRAVVLFAMCWSCQDASDDRSETTDDSAATVAPSYCDSLGLTERAFHEGPYDGAVLKGIAEDFTLSTTDGDWTFSDHYTGCDTYLFILSEPTQAGPEWPALWSRDAKPFLSAVPDNTHVFFVSSADNKPGMNDDLDLIQDKMGKALEKLSEEERDWWSSGRIHVVDKQVDKINNWVGSYLRVPHHGFGIDRFQRIRDVGSLSDVDRYDGAAGWWEPNLTHVAFESILYNFEADREDRLESQDATVIETWQGDVISDGGWAGVRGWIEVDFPSTQDMAAFDSMEVDMDMTCDGDGEVGTCPAWDRLTHMYICAQPIEATNPYDSETCQPRIAGVDLVEEVLGTCTYDGVAGVDMCTDAVECPSVDTGYQAITCEGYVAPVAYVQEVPADTYSCQCEEPEGHATDAEYVCNSEGTGYDECNCACNTEFARWITTYHREGRWVNDAHQMLPLVADGGTQKFSYYSIDGWEVDIDIRLFNQDLGARATESHDLFAGGSFGLTYNDKYAPIEVDIPADATKVELAVIISGHGMEDPDNCAEFCNTQHHFGVNGTENLIEWDYIGEQEYCQEDVVNGTIPNQYGTWFYARSNWCPGKEVAPIFVDVTDQVTPGQTATLTYYGDKDGAPYASGGASISMSSRLVIWQ